MNPFHRVMQACRSIKPGPEDDFKKQRLVYHYEHPDKAQPAIFSSYCPVITCSVLQSLQHREQKAAGWLIEHFVDQFGPGKKVDLLPRSDPRLLVCVNQIFTTELRLFEAYFNISFTWSGFERRITDGSYIPFTYTRLGLAQYYRRETLFHVRGQNNDYDQGEQSRKCQTAVERTVDACFPRGNTSALISPDFHSFNYAQMAAWSLATSVSTVLALGSAVGSDVVLVWGSDLLGSWEGKFRDVMASGDDVTGAFDSIRPEYNETA